MFLAWVVGLLACCAQALCLAEDSHGDVVFRESFEDGIAKWSSKGDALRATVVKSEYDQDGMLRLDNSAGQGEAFFGVQAGPKETPMAFSFHVKNGLPANGKVGLHRHAGAIKWVEVDDTWRQVSLECKSHEQYPYWYVVVPTGGIVLVDAVELREVKLTDAEKRKRLESVRAQSERGALDAYLSTRRASPGRGTSPNVHGKYPIGYYIVRATADRGMSLNEIFAELSSGGVNFVHNSDFEDWPEHAPNYNEINNNRRAKEYLDSAHAHGLGVLMSFDRTMVVRANLTGLRERVSLLKDHPGLWGWYLIDEPSITGASPDATRKAYETVREADRAHSVVLTECNADLMGDYWKTTDIMITDSYPVSLSPLFSMVMLIERALAACEGKKPVWVAIQVCNNDLHVMRWGDIGHLITNPREPTVEEVRCMAYLAIAHGASGLMFFAYDATYLGQVYADAERYKGILKLTREISSYSRELLGDCLAKGTVRGKKGALVSYIVRGQRKGPALLIAVNSFDRAAGPVQIHISKDKRLTVNLRAHQAMVKRVSLNGGG